MQNEDIAPYHPNNNTQMQDARITDIVTTLKKNVCDITISIMHGGSSNTNS